MPSSLTTSLAKWSVYLTTNQEVIDSIPSNFKSRLDLKQSPTWLHLCLGLPKGLFPVSVLVKILNAFWLHGLPITLTILGEWYKLKFLIVESSPLSIHIPLGPKYSPQDPVFKYP